MPRLRRNSTLVISACLGLLLAFVLYGVHSVAGIKRHVRSRRGIPSRYEYKRPNAWKSASVTDLVADSGFPRVDSTTFVFGRAGIQLDHLTLRNLGVVVNKNGELTATGRLSHSKLRNPSVKRTWVRAYIRAFGGKRTKDESTPGPVLWELTHTFWVTAGSSEYVDLTDDCCQARIRKHYGDVTRIEVELQYRPLDSGRIVTPE